MPFYWLDKIFVVVVVVCWSFTFLSTHATFGPKGVGTNLDVAWCWPCFLLVKFVFFFLPIYKLSGNEPHSWPLASQSEEGILGCVVHATQSNLPSRPRAIDCRILNCVFGEVFVGYVLGLIEKFAQVEKSVGNWCKSDNRLVPGWRQLSLNSSVEQLHQYSKADVSHRTSGEEYKTRLLPNSN